MIPEERRSRILETVDREKSVSVEKLNKQFNVTVLTIRRDLDKLDKQGANGLVLFNRFINPEINIKSITTSTKASFDDPVGFYNSLRWIALLSGKLNLDLAASGNIRTSEDAIKQLLAGASVIQIASVIYKNGFWKIEEMLNGLKDWMKENNFNSVGEFRGKLNQENNPQDEMFFRAQYVKKLAGVE